MNLEELIYRRFAGAEELTRHLTKYAGLPAVFSPEAPDDDQPGWNGEGKYPQITYQCDMQANEERKSAGTLAVTLVCQNTAEVSPEAIEDEIRKCLRDLLLVPDDEKVPYAFTWARTDAFTMPEKSPLLIGSDIRFDILEYGPQETTDPDPVMAVNQYIKSLYPEALVIGWDRIGSITEASKERPVAYCRLENVELSQETNTVAWMDCRLAVHFCARTPKQEGNW